MFRSLAVWFGGRQFWDGWFWDGWFWDEVAQLAYMWMLN